LKAQNLKVIIICQKYSENHSYNFLDFGNKKTRLFSYERQQYILSLLTKSMPIRIAKAISENVWCVSVFRTLIEEEGNTLQFTNVWLWINIMLPFILNYVIIMIKEDWMVWCILVIHPYGINVTWAKLFVNNLKTLISTLITALEFALSMKDILQGVLTFVNNISRIFKTFKS